MKSLIRRLPKLVRDPLLTTYYWALVRRAQGNERDLLALSQVIGPGATVVDVGANIGVYTYALAKLVGPSGHVDAFEPVGSTARLLRSTIRSNRLHNVTVHELAMSATPGTAEIITPTDDYGNPNMYRATLEQHAFHGSVERQQVLQSTLDLELATRPSPDFIKIDIEGHELECLRGARTALQHRPPLLVEIDGHHGGPQDQENHPTIAYLVDRGYTAHWFDGETFATLSAESPNPTVNYWFFATT